MYEELIKAALKARLNAYTPYSEFMVGAALFADNGKRYDGCNIENGAFSPTCCAERVAFFKAVSEGERQFKAIAVVGGKRGKDDEELEFCAPCGVCRQVMAEFCGEDFKIILYGHGEQKVYTLSELLPQSFGLKK